uniref:MFS domain-containing protein n=1 Tax=Panagrellus redivivus TaxID=6233 RepID=A0A7E4VPV8_PANRE
MVGTFVWTPEEQSLLFSAGFYGNLAIMWMSGYLADRFGPTKLLFIGATGISIIALLSPTAAVHSYPGFVGIRAVNGLFETTLMPSFAAIIARWFPASERSTVGCIYSSGSEISSSIGVVIASNLCNLEFLGGWPLIFYLNAFITITWLILLVIFATNSPQTSRFLSESEKRYLQNKTGHHHRTFKQRKSAGEKLPVAKIFTSPAFFAIVVGQFAYSFTNCVLSFYLPTYLRDVMQLDLKENGIYASVVFFIQLFSKLILSVTADVLKSKKILSHTTSAKIFQVFSNTITAIASLILGLYIDCSHEVFIIFVLCLYGIGISGTVPGCFTALVSIAPSYAGTLTSCSLVVATFANILSPWSVAFIVKKGTRDEWAAIFVVIAMINLISSVVFGFFGTTAVQPWAHSVVQNESGSELTERQKCKALIQRVDEN